MERKRTGQQLTNNKNNNYNKNDNDDDEDDDNNFKSRNSDGAALKLMDVPRSIYDRCTVVDVFEEVSALETMMMSTQTPHRESETSVGLAFESNAACRVLDFGLWKGNGTRSHGPPTGRSAKEQQQNTKKKKMRRREKMPTVSM